MNDARPDRTTSGSDERSEDAKEVGGGRGETRGEASARLRTDAKGDGMTEGERAEQAVAQWVSEDTMEPFGLVPREAGRLVGRIKTALDDARDARDREWGVLLLRMSGGQQSDEAPWPCPNETSLKVWLAAHGIIPEPVAGDAPSAPEGAPEARPVDAALDGLEKLARTKAIEEAAKVCAEYRPWEHLDYNGNPLWRRGDPETGPSLGDSAMATGAAIAACELEKRITALRARRSEPVSGDAPGRAPCGHLTRAACGPECL